MDAHFQPPLGDSIHLEPHNPEWAKQFELEKTRILQCLGASGNGGVVWAIHHIGSTAIYSIQAKPVLDILLLLEPAPLEETHLLALGNLGYEYRGEAGIVGRQFFRTNPRNRHLHAFPRNADEVKQHLLFRDYLNNHPSQAKRYEALKLELAAQFSQNREAYTSGKAALIRELLEQAAQWRIEHPEL
jgi:GrpB-like predicted nucleotidyltransferase (UPF0157 family)